MHHRLVQLEKLVRLSLNSKFRRGIRFGVGASIEHIGVLRTLEIASLVDIGANVGQFTLLATGLTPQLSVDAFEPLAAPCETFRKLFAGNSNVQLHQCAIGSQPSTSTMNVSKRHDSSSLLPISALQQSVFPGTERVAGETVRVTTLATELDPARLVTPAFLKIDVQGFELEALRGCGELLHRFQYVYAELSFIELYSGQALAPEVIDFLSGAGFGISGVYNTQFDSRGQSIQCDCLFSRRHLS